ncbi:MAG TPA: DUF6481 family protein [Allosphingosinicella sp.]
MRRGNPRGPPHLIAVIRRANISPSFKDPSFQSRIGSAAEAKQKALDNLRSRPPVDEKVVAERQAARLKREAADAERRSAKKEKEQAAEEKRAAEAARAEETEGKAEAAAPPATEAERKAARDARYAARKNRR